MANKIPVTVLVPTLNAGEHLNRLLDSVQPYFEDVFIVDSRSTDDTVDICLRRGVKIVQRPFDTHSKTYAFLMHKVPIKTPWIFMLDHDEEISQGLREKIATVLEAGTTCNGFYVRWRLWFMGRGLHVAPWSPRLMRTEYADVTDVACNEHFFLKEGKWGYIDGFVEHHDTPTLWHWYEKQNLYTTREAIGIVNGTARVEKPKLFGNSNERNHWFALVLPKLPLGLGYLLMFLGYYLKFKAWKDGATGYYWAKCRVWVQWVTFFKVKEIRRTGVLPKMPDSRHGEFDARVMESELEKQLLPDVVAEWKKGLGK